MKKLMTIIVTCYSIFAYGQGCDNLAETISTWTYDSLVIQGTETTIRGLFDSGDKRNQKFEIAICLFDAAIERNGNDANPYSWRGLAKEKLGRYESALVDYTKASKLDPNNFKHYEGKGNCKIKLEDYYGAIDDISIALTKTNPKDYSEYHSLLGSLGLCYYLQNKLDLAFTTINRAIQLNKDVGKYYLLRGYIQSKQKKIKEACLDFSKAGELGTEEAFKAIKENCK